MSDEQYESIGFVTNRVLLSARVTPRFSDGGISVGNPKAPFVPGFHIAGRNSLSMYQTHENQEGEEEEKE